MKVTVYINGNGNTKFCLSVLKDIQVILQSIFQIFPGRLNY